MKLNRYITKEEKELFEQAIKNRELNFDSTNNYYGVASSIRDLDHGLSNESIATVEKINQILKEVIAGFDRFYNFTHSKKAGKNAVRFCYNWNYDNGYLPYSGVGYISIDELANGFEEKAGK